MENEENDVIESESSTDTEQSEDSAEQSDSESTVESRSVPYARFKEVNDRLKALEQGTQEQEQADTAELSQPNALSKDEVILYAKGFEEEEVQKINRIAAIEEISVAEAAKSDIFQAWKESQEKQRKAEQASLGASRGSGQPKPKKDFSTPQLSQEDHKSLWKKRMGL